MEATELLTQQHRETETLFERFEQSSDTEERAGIARQAILDLRLHTAIEEELFYPAIREKGGELEEAVLEDLEEHHVVEILLDELESMDSIDARYEAKFTVLKELVLHHVEEEEEEQFPMVREEIGGQRLEELGEKMLQRYEELQVEAEGEQLSKEELYQRAQALGIEGRSQMTKRQLVTAVLGHHTSGGT